MKTRRGFSLVELIVSLSIFSMLSISIFYVFGTELKISRKITGVSEKLQLANSVMDRLSKDIRAACAILPSSDANSLVLSIEADCIEYSLINEKVRRKKNNYSAYLTDRGQLKALTFSYLSSRMVEVNLDSLKSKYLLRN